MNALREMNYLNTLLGVVCTSLGLLFILNRGELAGYDIKVQMVIIWLSIGVLLLLNGIINLITGIQGIMDDIKAKKEGKSD
jgi:uncharacterized membrane protein HdeD (DUF308 family)